MRIAPPNRVPCFHGVSDADPRQLAASSDAAVSYSAAAMSNPRTALPRARRLYPLGLLIASLLDFVVARAAPLAAPTVHWVRGEGAETCAEPRALTEHVEALIAAPLARASEAEHAIEGLSERTPGGFRARLRLFARDGRLLGERSLETGQGCTALTGPVAFVVAMMIDPEVVAHGLPPELMALLGEDAPEQELLAQLEREPAPSTPAAITSADAVPERKALELPAEGEPARMARFQLTAAAGGAFFSGPQSVPIAHLLAVGYLRTWLSLGISAWAGAALGAQRVNGRSFRLDVAGLAALVCGASSTVRRFRLSGCLGPALRLRHARGQGFGRDQSTTLVSAGAAAVLSGRVRLRAGWGLTAALGLALGFSPISLVYASADGTNQRAYRFARTDLTASLGPSYEF